MRLILQTNNSLKSLLRPLPSDFQLRAWHESLGNREASLMVADGRPTVITLLDGTPSD